MSSWNMGLLGAASAGKERYWIATIGSTAADYAEGVAVDSSGDIYVAGYSSINNTDAILTKQGPDGLIKWQRSLSGTNTDLFHSVAIDNAGDVYVTGYSNSPSSLSGDNILIVKYNSAGTLQWQRLIGGNNNDEGYSIDFDSNNDLYLGGYTNSFGGSVENFLLMKLSRIDGSTIWARTLSGSSSEYAYSVAVDSANGIYITGYSSSTGNPGTGNNIVIAKYTTSGDLSWQKVLGSTGNDIGRSVAVDSGNNAYVLGYTDGAVSGVTSFILAKYNSASTLQWQRTLSGAPGSYGMAVAVDSLNNVYVSGYTYVVPNVGGEFLIAKYNSSGVIQWQRTLGGPSFDINLGMTIDSKDNLYVVGYTGSTGEGSADFIVAKLPPDGSLTGSYILDGVAINYAPSSLTDAVSSFVNSDGSLTSNSQTLTNQAASLTSQTPALVVYRTEGSPSVSWITGANLPVAQRNVAYTTTLVAAVESMSSTVSYQILSGSLPTGLSLNTSTGVISGTSTSAVATVSSFTVRATSSQGVTSDRTFNIPTVMAYRISNVDVLNISPYTEQYYVINSSRSVTVTSPSTNCAIVMVGGGASGTFNSGSTSTQGGRGGTVYTTSGVSISAQTTNVTVGAGGGMSFSTSSNPGGTTSAFGWSAGGGSGSSGGAGTNGSNAGASIMTVVAPYVFDSSTLSQYAGLSTGYLGGWGAGGTSSTTPLQGGLGGGGNGISCGQNPTSGAYLSGGGGGGGGAATGCGNSSVGSNGGDGLIVIRIPNQ